MTDEPLAELEQQWVDEAVEAVRVVCLHFTEMVTLDDIRDEHGRITDDRIKWFASWCGTQLAERMELYDAVYPIMVATFERLTRLMVPS